MPQEEFKFKLSDRTLAIIDWANVYGWQKDLKWNISPEKLFAYLSSYPEIFDKMLYFGVEKTKQWSEDFNTKVLDIGYNVVSKEVKFVPVSLDKSYFRKIIKNLFDVLDEVKSTNTTIATELFELKQKIEERLGQEEPDYDSDGNVSGVYPVYLPEDGEIYNDVYALIEKLDGELKKLNINITDLQGNLAVPVMRRKCDFDVEIARDVFNLSQDFDQLILFSGDGDYAALVEDLVSRGKKVIVVFASGHKGKEYDRIKKGLFLCPVEKLKASIST